MVLPSLNVIEGLVVYKREIGRLSLRDPTALILCQCSVVFRVASLVGGN